MAQVVDRVRDGAGPLLVEAATYRWHGHYEGDPERYRSPDELEEWRARDPLLVHEAALPGGRGGRRDQGPGSVDGRGARRCGRGGAPPGRPRPGDRDGLRRAGAADAARTRAAGRRAPVFRTMDAVRSALAAELAEDDRVFIAGVDVGAGGNVFGLTRGLAEEFRGACATRPSRRRPSWASA